MSGATPRGINGKVLGVFAPILVVAGIGGFLLPPELSLTSGAPAYNVFHLVFGAAGIALVLSRKESAARSFNLGFGAIDLYQAAASFLHLFPAEHFRWKPADDVLHVAIGLFLMLVGVLGKGERPSAPRTS